MTAGTPRKKVGRGYERDLDAGPFRPMTDSFDLHLRAERKSPKTIRIYVDAVLWFAAAYLIPAGLSDWSKVKARHVQQWVTTLLADYSDSYANNQFRAIQQFFTAPTNKDLSQTPEGTGSATAAAAANAAHLARLLRDSRYPRAN
jgi:hypothetical protein